ncbi:hypothetical protein SLS56_011201 [Neofusicoccum ribis]|uniref:Uncharacterized protein n=1 Tax=Neofusicoccum ribis TaxID=45134 RepID=A0ABR3SCW4_9PEZI
MPSRKRPRRALLEAGPSTTNAHAGGGDGGSVFDGNGTLFSEDVGFGGEEFGVAGGRRDGSKTWGDRFSSWSFGRADEPVKTPPKRQQQQGVQQQQQQRRRRREQESEMEVRPEVVDLD